MKEKLKFILFALVAAFIVLPVHAQEEKTIKRKVAIGRFSNETQYGKGLFYDKENDPMRKQAMDILSSKLAASGKFILLERDDLDILVSEAGDAMDKVNADYIILGSITEFGRKVEGEQKVFSSSKTQTVEAAVSIRLVEVSSGLIIYSDEAKGFAETTTKKSLGVGGTAGFDATLSDKAISAALSQLVENIINKCMDKPWRSYFLSVEDGVYIISGGADQGAVSFVSKKSFPITVIIDGKEYNVMSVKDKAYKTDRKIKRTAKNTIKVSTGQHEIKVMAANDIIYYKKIFVSATEHKIIEL